MLIHFVVCLATRPQPLSKRFIHRVRSSAVSFKFQYIFFSSSRIRLLLRRLVSSIFPSITCFTKQLGRKFCSVQLTFLRFTVCRIFLPSLTLCNTSFFTRSFLLTYFLLQRHISELSRYVCCTLRVFTFQHHGKLCSRCSILLVSSVIKVQFADETSLLVGCRFCQGSPGFYFACASCITCSQAGQTVGIFRILHFLIYGNLHWLY